jgi:serine/threonine-protein kinase HipA
MSLNTTIYVFADWFSDSPKLLGVLLAQQAKGRKAFSFEYNKDFLLNETPINLDPDIKWYTGLQYPLNKEIFGVFSDAMPDTWGRTLMKRRAAILAKENSLPPQTLYEIDYLLGTYDETRMGALRFKLDIDGPFLDDNSNMPAPPWAKLQELQKAVEVIESDSHSKTIKKWLAILLASGSSLGGARPKANIVDEKNNLWIAKFPSKNDTIDKAAWEFLVYKLATNAGIEMAESKIEKVSGNFHTFLTKRFDRKQNLRIHFASSMTMTGRNEELLKSETASYLDLAEFIHFNGVNIKQDLKQLWRRIVFNIAISNTDDHLRNHGFLLTEKGWKLSPAYDLNPSIDKDGLAMNIDYANNSLDFELAKSVGEYFQLKETQMTEIIGEVKTATVNWKILAKTIGISRVEIEMMEKAFNLTI